jgi:CBS-domain-containing membrane protein
MFTHIASYLGIDFDNVSHTERLVSTAGGVLVIFCIFIVTRASLGPTGALLIIPSMGASAVLLFAVPHGALSQPWNVFGGHLISALVGVTCAIVIPNEIIAASLAVGLAIGAMHYLRCIHPPGGATALAAVIGGDVTHALGYQFVITPVLINVLVMLGVAVAFNYLFPWRRYPEWLGEKPQPLAGDTRSVSQRAIEHADLVYALSQLDTIIPVSEHDLLRIYELATGQADQRQLRPEQVIPGHYYSNGLFRSDWCVRQIVDASPNKDANRDMVVYKVVAGAGLRSSAMLTRSEFARWASYEVSRDDGNWKRVEDNRVEDNRDKPSG